MKIYHGTSISAYRRILKYGIKPRASRKGNWEDHPSHKDLVYLTTTYPFYFAIAASPRHAARFVALEINLEKLDESRIFPDEDFVYHALTKQVKNVSHAAVRDSLESYRHHWQDSLNYLGNVAYRGTIPVSAITRCCIINCNYQNIFTSWAAGPSISPINFKIMGSYYRDLISWAFGDRPDLPIDNATKILVPNWEKQCEELSANRKGIEIINLQ